MNKTLGQLFHEADELIMGKQAARAVTPATPSSEIAKLAAELLATPAPAPVIKTAAAAGPSLGAETICKLAHARALMDVFVNLPTLAKMAAVETRAREAGAGEEKIAAFFEKNAASFPIRSSLESANWLTEG